MTVTVTLTDRERAAIVFIHRFIDENGYSPNLRELVEPLGLAGKSSSHKLVTRLCDRGLLHYVELPGRYNERALTLTDRVVVHDGEVYFAMEPDQ